MGIVILRILIFLSAYHVEQIKSVDPIVQTHCGKVAGKSFQITSEDGNLKPVYEFVNIPYAIPPMDDLRWRAPVDLEERGQCWNGTLKYNDRIIQCPQREFHRNLGDEDCLVLSVNTPNFKSSKLLPVVFWIHGGGMTVGHSRIKGYYPDVEFTASMNVVSVTINYRLGYFGFLSLKELWEDKPSGGFGNYGIMDQILALKWVQKNIRNFGGNPKQVTVFGESGGGTATYALLASSRGLTKGLFQKLIPMSGLSNFRITYTKANELFRPIINKTECVRNTKQDVAKCLRSVDKATILNISKSSPMTGGYQLGFPFNKPVQHVVPIEVVDPWVLKYSLEKFMSIQHSSKEQHTLDILLGNLAQETFISWGYPGLTRWDSWKVLQNALTPKFDSFKKGSYPSILKAYRSKSPHKLAPKTIDPFYVYTTMISDVRVGCTTSRKAKLFSRYKPFRVISYVISQPLEKFGLGHPTADHAFDTFALFGYKFDVLGKYNPTKNDKKLMKNIRTVFRSFFHSDPMFYDMYRDKTMEFWNNTIVKYTHSYHEKECKMLRDIGLLRHAWGNFGIYED